MLKISSEETAEAVLGLWLIGTGRIYSGGVLYIYVCVCVLKTVQHTNYFRAIFENVIGPILRRARCSVRRIWKHPLWAWHLALLQSLKRYWKISSQAFWWLSQCCWNPLGSGRTCHGWRSCGSLHSHAGISLFLWAKLGTSFLIHCESRRKVTPGHSFKTWAIECFGVGFFFFLRSAEKDILHPWVVCSSVSHLFQMEKDSYLFLKRVFLTLQYTILKSTVA